MRIRARREHDALMEALSGRVIDSDEGRWLVVSRPQYSYHDGSTIAEHVFEIEEYENRVANMLRVADLPLSPERYHEESSAGEGVEVTARVALTDPNVIERLTDVLAAQEPVSVIREGVDDAPRQMVVSVLGWSQRENESVFELQCREPDTSRPRPLIGWPWKIADVGHVAYLVEWRLAVSALLVEKGILSKEEVDRVSVVAEQNMGRRRVKFMQVDDVRSNPFKGDQNG